MGLLALGALAAFLFPHQVLCVDSGQVRADAIVLLGGGAGERAKRAAQLFKEHAAPKIILSGEGDAEANRRTLIADDVPADAIQIENKSRNTKENAQFSVALLKEGRTVGDRAATIADGGTRNAETPSRRRTVILVTSWYHSRRALCSFRHYAPEIQFYSRPAYTQDEQRTNETPESKVRKARVRFEYLKLLGYWVLYGIRPF